jgi:serine/threonine protein phosphatase PrpC
MKTNIQNPLSLHEIGKRDNNEDNIFPEKGNSTSKDKLFIVCDGVGGSEKGEIASEIACNSFSKYFTDNKEKVTDSEYMDNALIFVEDEFDKYFENNSDAKGMGTTLTLLHFNDAGATVVHCGDSRVYQLRGGKIIHKTNDHSYLNYMVESGAMSAEEAENHPKKNVILRAIQGSSVKKTELETQIISDILEEDYFFLCTDGILESITDDILVRILSKDTSDKDKIDEIHVLCKKDSRDNFSAYLIKVKSVEGKAKTITKKEDDFIDAVLVEEDVVKPKAPAEISPKLVPKVEKKNNKMIIIGVVVVLVALVSLWNLYTYSTKNTAEPTEQPTVPTKQTTPSTKTPPDIDNDVTPDKKLSPDQNQKKSETIKGNPNK